MQIVIVVVDTLISIHALLAESDRAPSITPAASRNFYPRSPCGERHHIFDDISGATSHFYPRSPCGERHVPVIALRVTSNFYPRSPCGERRRRKTTDMRQRHFYPRSPCGERREQGANNRRERQISIHALLAESDVPGTI